MTGYTTYEEMRCRRKRCEDNQAEHIKQASLFSIEHISLSFSNCRCFCLRKASAKSGSEAAAAAVLADCSFMNCCTSRSLSEGGVAGRAGELAAEEFVEVADTVNDDSDCVRSATAAAGAAAATGTEVGAGVGAMCEVPAC